MRKRYRGRYSNTKVFQEELEEKLLLWILRVIVKTNSSSDFINNSNNVEVAEIVDLIDFKKYSKHYNILGANIKSVIYEENGISSSDEEQKCKKLAIIEELRNILIVLENKKDIKAPKILSKNINKISKLMNLSNYDEEVLEFAILQNQFNILDDTTSNLLGNSLNTSKTKIYLAIILDMNTKELEKVLSPNSKLSKSSVLKIDTNRIDSLNNKLDLIDNSFADNMLNVDEDIEYMIKSVVCKCEDSELVSANFKYINKDLSILVPYLEKAVCQNRKGVNVLLYGVPGTGKTELSKVIAKKLNSRLFEISYTSDDDSVIRGSQRLEAYKSSQALLSNKKTLLMFDEIEDVFRASSHFGIKQDNKAWINRMLENNPIPTIWITNDIKGIDNAIIRRFDMSIEVPIPSKSVRKEIIQKYTNNLISKNCISFLSKNKLIAPALISRASSIVSLIDNEENDDNFKIIINNTLKAQGHALLDNSLEQLPNTYNPDFVNAKTDLNKLANGIKESQNARICLYGPAGTGKSAYSKYIAQFLEKEILIKKVSDLMSKWIGETEKNIANAFKEAKNENAVLVFDEVDSFLSSRKSASKSWEVTQVNEMLVQMENFNGIFIATTNLMNNLDEASLRRFDLKLEFDYLKSTQVWELFKAECKELGFKEVEISFKKKLKDLEYLTPGDFAAIKRQDKFNKIKNCNDFLERLEAEMQVKEVSQSTKMGFF